MTGTETFTESFSALFEIYGGACLMTLHQPRMSTEECEAPNHSTR